MIPQLTKTNRRYTTITEDHHSLLPRRVVPNPNDSAQHFAAHRHAAHRGAAGQGETSSAWCVLCFKSLGTQKQRGAIWMAHSFSLLFTQSSSYEIVSLSHHRMISYEIAWYCKNQRTGLPRLLDSRSYRRAMQEILLVSDGNDQHGIFERELKEPWLRSSIFAILRESLRNTSELPWFVSLGITYDV